MLLGLGSCKPLHDNRSCIGALCCPTTEPSSHYGRGKIPRVSQASPSAKNRAFGKANLPRVLHSGKNSTRRREALPSAAKCLALGKERHSAKALFPECNTRGRAALDKEKCYLTAQPAHAVKTKKLLCRVSPSATGTRGNHWLL